MVPRYLDVSRIEREERVGAVLATAALPFGIVPPVLLQGAEYVDGGMADNVPLYPLVSLYPCDELVIVRLWPEPLDYISQDDKKRWRQLDRLMRLATFTDYEDSFDNFQERTYKTRNNPPEVIPFRDPEHWPSRILVLRPKRKLGNLITGTMNFTANYAQKLIDEGQHAAAAFVREHEIK